MKTKFTIIVLNANRDAIFIEEFLLKNGYKWVDETENYLERWFRSNPYQDVFSISVGNWQEEKYKYSVTYSSVNDIEKRENQGFRIFRYPEDFKEIIDFLNIKPSYKPRTLVRE